MKSCGFDQSRKKIKVSARFINQSVNQSSLSLTFQNTNQMVLTQEHNERYAKYAKHLRPQASGIEILQDQKDASYVLLFHNNFLLKVTDDMGLLQKSIEQIQQLILTEGYPNTVPSQQGHQQQQHFQQQNMFFSFR
jgi:hypothetical protein